MMKFRKKSLVLLVCVTLLLTFAVSGTVAFLADNDGPVTNTFTPTKVEVTVEDEVTEDGAKQNVIIHNNSDIPVYIRVAVVAYWVKDKQIVAPWNAYDLPIASGWNRASDGFYYYGPTTEEDIYFFQKDEKYSATSPVNGAHLEMDIIVQAVQADGMNATNAQDAFAKAAVVSTAN